MKITLLQKTLGTIIALITIFGSLFAVSNYFAKADDVVKITIEAKVRDQLIEERLDISIQDDKIYRQEQYIQRIEDNVKLEERSPTATEQEILEERQQNVEELKKQRTKKTDYYEQMKKDR
ncbi:MAG: hypothetical protein J7L15_08675 [Clostridiales bacterium]|nr:hypothetical protein [Clostridiales bacterium]